MEIKRMYAAVTAAALLSGCAAKQSGSVSREPAEEKTFAAVISDRLDHEDYDITLTVTGDTPADGTQCRMVRHGSDGLVSMVKDGIGSDFYTYDGKRYMLFPAIMCYRRTSEYGAFGNAFIKLGEGDTLFDIEEDGRMRKEIYTSSGGEDLETYTFTFDEESGRLLNAVTENKDSRFEVVVEEMKWGSDEIILPDLSLWDDLTEGTEPTPAAKLKFNYYMKGITPAMVDATGYTYEQIAELSPEETELIGEVILEDARRKHEHTESPEEESDSE